VYRYLFGVNAEIKGNLHIANDSKLVYVAGHNVVVCRLEDRSQYFLPGTSDAENITAIALSADSNYLAICERGIERGLLIIYDLAKPTNPKVLPETLDQLQAFTSKEMVAVSFSCKDSKKIVTLSGAPDYKVMLWRWEDTKLLCIEGIGLTGNLPEDAPNTFQVSWNPDDFNGNTFVVTGPESTFRYLCYDYGADPNCLSEMKHSLIAQHS